MSPLITQMDKALKHSILIGQPIRNRDEGLLTLVRHTACTGTAGRDIEIDIDGIVISGSYGGHLRSTTIFGNASISVTKLRKS